MSEAQDLARDTWQEGVGRAGALPLSTVGAGMHCCRLVVAARDVVFVKGLIEAHDGLAGVFSDHGGELLLAAPLDRAAELAEVVRDLVAELAAVVVQDFPQGPVLR
jgi:hypothetical protein